MSDDSDRYHHEVGSEQEWLEHIANKHPSLRAWPGRKETMSELLKINVNDHTERKNGLTYLSWAWAWAEVLKIDPGAEWEAVEYPQPDGTVAPCLYTGGGTAMVKTKVTIKSKTRACMLPVMNHKNQAIKDPDSFAINTAIMRCMTKAISMHGLGLYIYAGEDLPEGEEPAPAMPAVIPASFRSSPTMGAMESLPPQHQQYIRDLAMEVMALDGVAARARIESELLEDDQKTALWSLLPSNLRAAIKKAGQPQNTRAPLDINPHTGTPTLASVTP